MADYMNMVTSLNCLQSVSVPGSGILSHRVKGQRSPAYLFNKRYLWLNPGGNEAVASSASRVLQYKPPRHAVQ